jgi:hypothetical protein
MECIAFKQLNCHLMHSEWFMKEGGVLLSLNSHVENFKISAENRQLPFWRNLPEHATFGELPWQSCKITSGSPDIESTPKAKLIHAASALPLALVIRLLTDSDDLDVLQVKQFPCPLDVF